VKTLETHGRSCAGGRRHAAHHHQGRPGGPAEALADALAQLSTAEVKVEVVHRAFGGDHRADVLLARASGAIIVGFPRAPRFQCAGGGRPRAVEIRTYRIIYEAVEEVKLAMEGMLAPEKKEVAGRGRSPPDLQDRQARHDPPAASCAAA